MKQLLTTLIVLLSLSVFGQHKSPYSIFEADGTKSNYGKMLKKIIKKDVVLFGEFHNNPVDHWLQFELISDLKDVKNLKVGAEMFETNAQKIIDDYFLNDVDQDYFENNINLWSNYKTDYKPILDYCKGFNIPFIATNTPAEYCTIVYRDGFEPILNLVQEEKNLLPNLPIPFEPELSQYKRILEMAGDHGTENTVKAQALKDATMAWFINENFRMGDIVFHINGTYHSNYHEGIYWYLNRYNPGLEVVTIATVEQDQIELIEEGNLNLADFIIIVSSKMTKSY